MDEINSLKSLTSSRINFLCGDSDRLVELFRIILEATGRRWFYSYERFLWFSVK